MRATRGRDLWLALSAVMLVGFIVFRNDTQIRAVLWTALGIAAVIVIVIATVARRLWARSAWVLVAIAIAVYVIGGLLFAYRIFNVAETERLWISIFTSATSYSLMIAAILVLVHMRRISTDASGYLDAAVVLVAAGMLAAEFLIYPILQDGTLETLERGVGIFNPILDVILLAATVRLWYATDRAANRAVRILAISFLLLVATNVVDMLVALKGPPDGTATIQGIIQVGYLLVYIVAAAAALDPTAVRPPAADTDAGLSNRSRVLTMLGLCILVPPVLLLFHRDTSTFSQSRAFVIATLVLTVLLGFRINLLVKGYREAVRREHLLREINAGLMRATSRTDVSAGLSEWAAKLVEQEPVSCSLGTVDDLAARGIGPFGTRVRNADGDIRYRTVVSVPGTMPRQRLVVDTPDLVSTPAQASLAVLGQSVGMALERLNLSRRVMEQATAERLELLLHNASDVIILVDAEGTMQYATEAMRDLTGQSPSEVVGKQWASLFQDPALALGLLERAHTTDESTGDLVIDPAAVNAEFADPAPSRKKSDGTTETMSKRVDVNVVWIEADDQFVATHHDVTDRVRLEQELKHQAFHDALTGLNNRSVFRDQLVRASTRARRTESMFAVLMLDLDDFKNVNDSLGHPAGDELLRVVARRLVECVREGDTPVRLGGDEFAAILESASSAEDAVTIADRIIERIAEPVIIRGNKIVTGASIGLAMSDGTVSTSDVERDADIALYEAKFDGKSRVSVFQSDMHETAKRKLSLTNELRSALDNHEIEVRYQPVVELATGAIAGVEALVRWNHPTLGELVPDMFVSIAEDSGQIKNIGEFVMRQALSDLSTITTALPKHSSLRMSINVSVKELQLRDMAETILQMLEVSSVEPSSVVVEVTESVFLPDEGVAVERLRDIANLGVSVYLDDFGTGWASLHYLRSLPISGVKLAQEFVTELPQDQDIGLVRAVRELSNTMQLEEVVAEGIENEDQRQALIQLGYRLAQGYLMAHPMSCTELMHWLEGRKSAPWNVAPPPPNQRGDEPAPGSSVPPLDAVASEPGATG